MQWLILFLHTNWNMHYISYNFFCCEHHFSSTNLLWTRWHQTSLNMHICPHLTSLNALIYTSATTVSELSLNRISCPHFKFHTKFSLYLYVKYRHTYYFWCKHPFFLYILTYLDNDVSGIIRNDFIQALKIVHSYLDKKNIA